MPDNGQIEGLPEGAVVKPLPSNQIEGLPEGAVVKPIGDQSTESVQPPADAPPQNLSSIAPEQPSWFERTLQTSGIKNIIDQAKANYADQKASQDAVASAFKSGDYGAMAEAVLHHLAKGAGHAVGYDPSQSVGQNAGKVATKVLGGPLGEAAVDTAKNTYEHGKKAIEAGAKAGDEGKPLPVGEIAENAAEAVPVLGQMAEQSVKPLAEDVGTGNVSGAVGDVIGSIPNAIAAKELLTSPKPTATASETAPKTLSAEETTAQAKPLKEAGERVQTEAKAVRDTKGKAVAAAKEAVEKSLPKVAENGSKQGLVKSIPHLEFKEDPLTNSFAIMRPDGGQIINPATGYPKRALSVNDALKWVGENQDAVADQLGIKIPKSGESEFPKAGKLKSVADKILSDTADTEQLAGAKDPDIAEVRDMADHLSKGQNAKGEPLLVDPKQADSIKRAFDQKIAALEGKVAQGGNAAALRHVKALKTAFNDDLFDSYEKYGDPEAAKALRSANKDYAQTVADQTQGPAKTSLKTQSPEKIVSNIVSGGAKSQSAVESLLKNSSKEGNAALRDSTLKEIYRQTSAKTADGNIDMNAARQKFNAMGDAGKKLFGEKYDETKQFLDAAAKEQVRRTEAANKPSVGKTIVTKSLKAVGAAEGASLAGVPGAVAGYAAGEAVGDAIYQQGKSGAVKIGISPTERIVLSPADAVSKRPLITKFLNAKSAGKTAAMTSAYNTIAGKPEKDDIESAIDNSDGSKESQDSIFQKIIAFNKASKTMDDDTKARIQKKIMDYNNALVKKNYK